MEVVGDVRPHAGGRWESWAFFHTTPACRVWVGAAVLAALVLPPVLVDLGRGSHTTGATLTGLLIVGLSVVNIELGRMLEGGVSDSQRPHKGLSAWALAAALLLPLWWLLPVVAVTYAHAWWRGLRVTPWKWVGSAAYVVVAGVAAAIAARAVVGSHPDLMRGDGGLGLLGVVAATAAFLAVETVLFHGSAYLNHPADEQWLRQTLAGAPFYVTEASVLLIGGLSAAIWSAGGWFVLLLAPIYLMAQRAALHETLRRRAEVDDKTGALRYESWRRLAVAGAERCHRQGRSWCVFFADVDDFRAFNETWGHLVGDEALAVVADAIHAELRTADVLGRFGGEEFCVFLPDVAPIDARGIAERIRDGVASAHVPGALPVTISIGVAAITATDDDVEFATALAAADRALYRAKSDGRNRTDVVVVPAA